MKPALALIAEVVVVPMVTEGVVAMVVVVVEVADPGAEGSEDIKLSGRHQCLIVVLVPA